MKHAITLLAIATTAFTLQAETIIKPAEGDKLAGRIQYDAKPGEGAESMNFVDQPLPQPEVRVGPSGQDGVGLAYVIAFQPDDEQRNALMMGSKIELVVNVLNTAMGGAPSPLKVVLLSTQSLSDPRYAAFGAWNNAEQLTELGEVDVDPEVGEHRFDATKALQEAPASTIDKPLMLFGIYAPIEDLKAENEGKHVIFGGEGEAAPKLAIDTEESLL